jgi:D-alanine transaminase
MSAESSLVYLNGDYLALSEAKISVLDRGFLFGDGGYEVIPFYQGRFFELEAHLNRLDNSLRNIRLSSPHNHQQWANIFAPLMDAEQNQYIYLQITRGVASKREHAIPADIQPTVFAMCSPIADLSKKQQGIKALTIDDTRWQMCNVKATTLLANILLRQEALDHDCAEAILVKDGMVTEGAASNIFAVIDGVLTTTPNNQEILPGITRTVILDLAKSNNIPVQETAMALSTFKQADEIWLTSSTQEILPVIELDSKPVGDGQPGAVWKTMLALFQDKKAHA